MKNYLLIAFTISLSTISISCSNGSSSNTPLKEQGPTSDRLSKASCKYSYNTGGSALMGNLNSTLISTEAFQKKFNRMQFDAIANASIGETVRYAQASGIELYKAPAGREGGCQNYASLPAMPWDLQNFWDSITSKDGPDTGFTLAVYLPKNEDSEVATTKNQTSIVIRTLNDRYTLVHEFMHHLFYTKAAEMGHTDSKIKKEVEQTLDVLIAADKAFSANKSEVNQNALVLALVNFTNAKLNLDLHFSLEEMAIENFLRTQSKNGTLTYVSKYGPYNGAKYIESSGNNATKDTRLLIQIKDEIRGELNSFYTSTAQDSQKLNTLSSVLYSRLSAIEDVINKNPVPGSFPEDSDLVSSFKLASNERSDDQTTLNSPCSHSKEAQAISQKISSALSQITLNSVSNAK